MSREIARQEARRMGEQKMREALSWWEAWGRSIHKYRTWATVFIARQYTIYQLDQQYGKAEVVAQAKELIAARNAAHDFMLLAAESIRIQGNCALACEGMARTYFEVFEEREVTRAEMWIGIQEDHG